MAETIVELLTDVADAIREKKGSNEPINAQSFADEIKNLPSGSSPFAVDFGEEIATGNAAYINALQEDIDYYNEIQRKRASGEVTDAQLLNDAEFKRKIAWWPKGMAETRLENYLSIRSVNFSSIQDFPNNCPKLERYKGKVSGKTLNSNNFVFTAVPFISSYEEDSEAATLIDGSAITNFQEAFRCSSFEKVRLHLPNVTNANSALGDQRSIQEIYIDMPNITAISLFARGCVAKKIYAHIPMVRSISSCFDISYNLEELYISGLAASLGMPNNNRVSVESIKYILDNCQAREDGASYTLTLNAAVKTAFLAKCDEDAEYAASLASANAKGLTLA